MAYTQQGVAAPLFRGRLVNLTAIDPEKDAAVEAGWTRDINFLHLYSVDLTRPLSALQIKKAYKETRKAEGTRRFTFGIRSVSDDRLVGKVGLFYVDFQHGATWLDMGIGLPADRGHGYGEEALELVTRFIFEELNMARLIVRVGAYNIVGESFLEKNGFARQVCLRQSIRRGGQLWDVHYQVLQAAEWSRRHPLDGGEA